MPEPQDHYAVLDLPRSASAAEIKRRYRELMREAHPDANAGDPAATRRAARINAAYETLGDPRRRREYDATLAGRANGKRPHGVYAHWAEQPDWEDIVAEHAPPKRPAHVHDQPPVIEPDAIDVPAAELQSRPRVRRTIRVENRCACTLRGDVSTTEPWVWGPIGRFEIKPGESVMFDIEVVASRVQFPGIARVQFVAGDWTGTVPVRIQGYEVKAKRRPPATDSAYVRQRGRVRRWGRVR
jgi:hypothetical protein